jgi:hypothetical protein
VRYPNPTTNKLHQKTGIPVIAKRNLHRLTIIASSCLALGAQATDDLLSRDALFGDDLPLPAAPAKTTTPGLKGFIQFEAARTTATPEHWSKLRTRAELGSSGKMGDGLKWKLGARLDYDLAYVLNDYYHPDVERNQRYGAELRENYLDYSYGNWEFRFGKQHVVWGEMVGLFFADVVSARDLREFILPEFDQMRIPQWAARAEYFAGDVHAELLWVPVASYDNIGKPGADFFPYQPTFGFGAVRYSEKRPERDADNMNYGVRLSTINNGWDVSGFYYRSTDISPTFYRTIVNPSTLEYQARHDRINQFGGAVTKDFGDVVFKAEALYSSGRGFTTLNLADTDGIVRQKTFDWAAGLDFTLPAETRFNVQFFQRQFLDDNPHQILDKQENGYSLLVNNRFLTNWEAQALFISSLNRNDWLFRPRLTWNFQRNWRLLVGADIFKGPALGMFGRYDQQDRMYSEVRYSF